MRERPTPDPDMIQNPPEDCSCDGRCGTCQEAIGPLYNEAVTCPDCPHHAEAPAPALRVCQQDEQAALRALETYAQTANAQSAMTRFRLFGSTYRKDEK